MIKQEEIKKEIASIILESLIHEMWCEPAPGEYGDVYHTGYATESLNKTVDNIFKHFHSQGLVIKVDGELPRVSFYTNYMQTYWAGREAMLDAGYTLTEELI